MDQRKRFLCEHCGEVLSVGSTLRRHVERKHILNVRKVTIRRETVVTAAAGRAPDSADVHTDPPDRGQSAETESRDESMPWPTESEAGSSIPTGEVPCSGEPGSVNLMSDASCHADTISDAPLAEGGLPLSESETAQIELERFFESLLPDNFDLNLSEAQLEEITREAVATTTVTNWDLFRARMFTRFPFAPVWVIRAVYSGCRRPMVRRAEVVSPFSALDPFL